MKTVKVFIYVYISMFLFFENSFSQEKPNSKQKIKNKSTKK